MIDTRLIVDSATAPARVAHEQNVIGTMNILAACGGPDSPVTKVVFKSSAHYYGCERDDPSFFTEDMRRPHPPRTRLESRHRRGRRRRPRLRRAQPGRHRDHAALLQRPRARPAQLAQPAARPARRARHPRLRPALPVHPRGRHRRRAPSRRHQRAAGDLQRRAGRGAGAERGRGPARQAVRAAAAAVGDEPRRPRRRACSASASRTRSASSCATGAAWTTAGSSSAASASDSRRGRPCKRLRPRCAWLRSARAAKRHIATSAKWRSSSAGRRASDATE